MTEFKLKIIPYSLGLKSEFVTAKGIISSRKGFIIEISSGNYKGYGDVAPFEEFGSESYEDAEKVLSQLKLPLNLDLNNIIDSLDNNLEQFSNTPAVRHGAEQALLNLFCKLFKTNLNELLNVKSLPEVMVNGIMGMVDKEEAKEKAEGLISQGYRTIKVKIGRDNFEDDLTLLNIVREVAGDSINLRADVNGKWKLKEAISNLKKMNSLDLEYVEQPVSGLINFIRLKNETGIKLAVDESARNLEDIIDFVDSDCIDFVILKPMMLGGIITTLRAKEYIESKNKGAVVTTTLDSVVGRSMAIFAASTIKPGIAHGLGTGSLFEKDFAPDPYKIANGIIILK